jgi:hypothetical protein
MANPDGAVEGTVAVRGSVARQSPDLIVEEIERTRENLARTIDELTDRVSPANNMRRLREEAAERLARPEVVLAVAAVGLVVAGYTVYRLWGRRRR